MLMLLSAESFAGVRVPVTVPGAGSARQPAMTDQAGAAGPVLGILGYSPGDQVAESDEEFVVDSGYPLDWYLFRGDGPIIFDVMIDRYFGPVDAEGHLLHPENVQAPNGMVDLTLRVWDVDEDYNGGDFFPEVDLVSVNGEQVGVLSGWNDQWSTVTLSVPLSLLRFPGLDSSGHVEPAANTIRIDVDVMNVGECECWAVAVDWARLVVRGIRPAVLVHGFFSSADTWNPWTQAGGFGEQVGLPVTAFSFANNHGSWTEHMLEEAQRIEQAKQQFGVEKLNIVGHSKGGLDSRAYLAFLAGDSVENLVMLGTPNAGSPVADLVKAAGIFSPLIGLASLIGEPALTELTVVYMNTVFNPVVGPNPNTAYYTVAGNWQGLPNGNPLVPGPDDSVVAVSSVESLPFATALGRTAHLHTDMTAGAEEWGLALPVLRSGASGANGGPEATSPALGLAGGAGSSSFPPGLNLSHLEWAAPATGTVSHSVALETSTSGMIGVLWPGNDTSVSLTGPDGQPVTSQSPGVSIVEVPPGSQLGLSGLFYQIDAPQAGLYEVAVNHPTEAPHLLMTAAPGSPISLALQVREPMVSVGDPAVLEAAFTAPAGVSAPPEVMAYVETPGGVQSIILLDDGQGADTMADDLVYTGEYLVTGAGYYPVVAKTESPVSRLAMAGFLAVGGEDRLIQLAQHGGVDNDGDGLFDILAVDIEVNAAQSDDYLLISRLEDAAGNPLVQTGGLFALSTGGSTLSLAFDGQALGESNFQGDLYLHATLLRSGGVIADVKAPLAILSGYDPSQFAHAPIRLLPGIQEEALDANQNGLYDELRLTVPVEAVPGYYSFNARLVDASLQEIAWTGGQIYLDGTGSLTLSFPGQAIGAHAVNGPYQVRDFTMYSSAHSLNQVLLHTTQPYLFTQFEGAPPVVQDGLLLLAPLSGTGPVTLPAGQELPIRFQWIVSGQPTLDQSVTIRIRDANNQLITGYTYGYGITYDPASGEYLQPFDPSAHGLQAGEELHIQVFFGRKLQGTATVILS